MAKSPSPQLTLGEFNDLIKNIEIFWGIGARLSTASSGQDCTFLIREASLAFSKTMMSLMGFLRFIPSSQYFTDQKVRIIDVSSASVMARQVLEDVVSFLYLSEPNLNQEEQDFREYIWRYHGYTESVESSKLVDPCNPDLATAITNRDKARDLLEKSPRLLAQLGTIEKNRRGRVRKGEEQHILHDREILARREIKTDNYDLPRKVLSNFAHFSAFSAVMIMETQSKWEESWPRFFLPTIHVAHFAAEALEAFIETFPQTRELINEREHKLIANYRGPLRNSAE
jgi:hypothetical protein